MRVAVVRHTRRGILHAVLTVRLGGETLVLDNLEANPVKQERLAHYAPIASFSENGIWAHLPARATRLSVAAAR